MRTKKILFYLLITLFIKILTSCSGSEMKNIPSEEWSNFPEGKSYTVEGEGGKLEIKFSTTEDWSLSTQEDWLEIAPVSGTSGANTIQVTVESNNTNIVRNSTLYLVSKQSKSSTEITITQKVSDQNKEPESGYLDMNLDSPSVQLTYEVSTGTVNVIYSNGNIPTIQKGKAIVLPDQYDHDIRVIEEYKIDGNKVSLNTKQGNMCDLFRNTEFTLTTDSRLDPLTRAGKGGAVITPSQVTLIAGNNRHVIYKKEIVTRADVNVVDNLYTFSEDYRGNVLYENGGNKLYWDKCSFDLGLNSVFYFNFSEEIKDEIRMGDLKEFSFYLDGNVDVDFLLKYLGKKELTKESDRIILKKVTPTLELKFLVGNVPVFISLDTNLGERFSLNTYSELCASAGLNFHSDARLGMSWCKTGGVEIIKDFEYEYNEYDPTFNAEGSLSAQVSYYPQIEISIYKFIGPWIDVVPYLQQDVKAGLQITGSGNNYVGWEYLLSSGVDTRMGLNFDFFLFNVNAYETNSINLVTTNLYTAPYNLSLVSPSNDLFHENEEINATFRVTSLLGDEEVPCAGAFVQFVGEGRLSRKYAISDEDGLVTVTWIPDSKSLSRAVYPITAVPRRLYVRVIGSQGEIIKELPWKVMID